MVRSPASYERQHDEAAWATGGLLAFSPETVARVGPWDERYFLYEEEVDFCLRAGDRGLRLRYLPHVQAVRHVGQAPVTDFAEALMRTNRIRHVRSRSGPVVAAAYYLVTLGAVTLRALRGRGSARAARSSLLRMLPPTEVMRRYAGSSLT